MPARASTDKSPKKSPPKSKTKQALEYSLDALDDDDTPSTTKSRTNKKRTVAQLHNTKATDDILDNISDDESNESKLPEKIPNISRFVPIRQSPKPAPAVPTSSTSTSSSTSKGTSTTHYSSSSKTSTSSSASAPRRKGDFHEDTGLCEMKRTSTSCKAIIDQGALTGILDHVYSDQKNEVLGLLGGQINGEVVHVRHIYAVERDIDNIAIDGVECNEMEVVKANQKFTELNLIFVGWYHSHPRIPPFPSQKDLHMQNNMQMHAQHAIGIICSPYYVNSSSSSSSTKSSTGTTSSEAILVDDADNGVPVVSSLSHHNHEHLYYFNVFRTQIDSSSLSNEQEEQKLEALKVEVSINEQHAITPAVQQQMVETLQNCLHETKSHYEHMGSEWFKKTNLPSRQLFLNEEYMHFLMEFWKKDICGCRKAIKNDIRSIRNYKELLKTSLQEKIPLLKQLGSPAAASLAQQIQQACSSQHAAKNTSKNQGHSSQLFIQRKLNNPEKKREVVEAVAVLDDPKDYEDYMNLPTTLVTEVNAEDSNSSVTLVNTELESTPHDDSSRITLYSIDKISGNAEGQDFYKEFKLDSSTYKVHDYVELKYVMPGEAKSGKKLGKIEAIYKTSSSPLSQTYISISSFHRDSPNDTTGQVVYSSDLDTNILATNVLRSVKVMNYEDYIEHVFQKNLGTEHVYFCNNLPPKDTTKWDI